MSRYIQLILITSGILAVVAIAVGIYKGNPKDSDKVILTNLGKILFFDSRISWNGSRSCSGCHHPDYGWSDGYRTSVTPDGTLLMRNSPGLLNCADQQFFNRADPLTTSLKEQHLRPLFHEHPLELGMHLDSIKIFRELSTDPKYKPLLKSLKAKSLNGYLVVEALSQFVQSIQSQQSKFDLYTNKKVALSMHELNGWKIFKKSKCNVCHPPPHFTRNIKGADVASAFVRLQNQTVDSGAYLKTGRLSDTFLFCIPTLKNVAITSPYMHDGSEASLKGALKIHAQWMPGTVPDFNQKEIFDLTHFLHTLTDTNYVAIP